MQQVNNNKTKRFFGLLEALFASQGGYLANSLYAFKYAENNSVQLKAIASTETAKLRWLILGREHYFETSKEYPIANKRDLKQALKFDDNKAPFKGVTLQHIERVNEQSHRVTFWVINPKILDKLTSSPWLILPESYLLAKALPENINLATIACPDKTLFISRTGQGMFSGIKSPQTPSVESFALATGSPTSVDDEQQYSAKATQFTALLSTGIKSLNVAKLSGFFVNLNNINRLNYPWKQAGVISVLVLTIYLALSSAWLSFEQQHLSQKIIDQKPQVNQALALQKDYQQHLQWQEALAEPLSNAFPYWHTWQIALEAIAVGADINAIHYQNEKIILHGTADSDIKATDVLAKLSENPNVLSASFSQPVRKYRNKEDFVISFSFAQTKAKQSPEHTAKQLTK